MKKLLLFMVLVFAGGAVGFSYWQRASAPTSVFRTVAVQRGDLLSSISATGTVVPVEVIDVGAQVAGRIDSLGPDPKDESKTIDYGSEVEQGSVLAKIDNSLYAADVERAEAEVAQAKSNVQRAEADLGQMQARLLQAEQNWKRAQELGPSRALSTADYEAYEAAYAIARATVAVGEATIAQTRTSVDQAEAVLRRAQTNLGYCTIRSPVKGVIIDRRVNIGQTVVASLNAPSLFLIAKDLRRMQVWVAVNEADIGSIHPGQAASFTTDAFAGHVFQGQVAKIRLNASMTQNVVTYTVEVDTENPDAQLLPYLTANVRFEVSRREGVLMVPNSALRWTPAPEQIVQDAQASAPAPDQARSSGGRPQGGGPGGGGPGGGSGRPAAGAGRGSVWVADGGRVRPIAVEVGVNDGVMTEVRGDLLKEGLEVIVGEFEQNNGNQTRSPFTPGYFRGSRQGT